MSTFLNFNYAFKQAKGRTHTVQAAQFMGAPAVFVPRELKETTLLLRPNLLTKEQKGGAEG